MRKVLVSMAVIVVLVVVLAAFLISNYGAPASEDVEETKPFHFGVTFGGNTTAEAKLLIDRVKDYTNVFFLQSGPVSTNETAVNEICDYAVDAGLDIIVYFGDLDTRFMNESKFWRINWLSYAKQRWGDSLLGVQYYDEPGGMFIDMNQTVWTDSWNMSTERDYDLAANVFNHLSTDWGFMQLETNGIDSFVTDYALYWFDYSIGYDIVLAQAGWNHSLTQDIALIRGAANMKNRNWGIIVTWTYSQPPYLDSGEATYEQMLAAYKAGADYIIIFNYPSLEGNNYGIMQDEHFEAMERFWSKRVLDSWGNFSECFSFN